MAKITLDNITSGHASTTLFNTNFTAIEDELNDKVLYRNNPVGEPNQMLNDLDMNSNDILNAGETNTATLKIGGVLVAPTEAATQDADNINYDNTTSGLTAVDVQAAIDEVEARQDIGSNWGKNLIINGDFSVWQRNTTQTTSGYGSDDRWQNNNTGSTRTHNRQSFTIGQTDVPNNPEFYSESVVTSVAGAGNFVSKTHKVENVYTTSGQTVTLSFWAKADAAKDIATEFIQSFGTGGSPSAAVLGIGVTTHNLTTSWQKFTVTQAIPSITGKTNGTDNNSYLGFNFWFDAGSNFDARTNTLGQQSGTFDIANVQLEIGSVATEFEFVSPADQLAKCKRYFERIGSASFEAVGIGHAESATQFQATLFYNVEKRGTPTVTYSSNTGFDVIKAGGSASSTVMASSLVTVRSNLHLVTTTGLTAGEAGSVYAKTNEYVDIDAEL